MKTTIKIPEKINVGYQNRSDTYTGKLAYVIYFDHKGVLRKETSWNSWRNKDIENNVYENVPTSGFVLNKKAGGYSSGWNHRNSYIRVYDSRGFEFEITPENLLYILENTNSIKGKGLEGNFVYGWSGKDLLLMPVDAPDYKEIVEFNSKVKDDKRFTMKDMIIGATYRTNQDKKWVYMGRYDMYKEEYSYGNDSRGRYGRINEKIVNKKKYYYFYTGDTYNNQPCFEYIKTVGDRVIETIDENCVENYADLFESLESKTYYSPYDKTKDEYLPYLNNEEFSEGRFEENTFGGYYVRNKDAYRLVNGKYEEVRIKSDWNWNNTLDARERKYVYTVNLISYEQRNSWSRYHETVYTPIATSDSPEKLFDLLDIQIYYKNEYLIDGKLYRKVG